MPAAWAQNAWKRVQPGKALWRRVFKVMLDKESSYPNPVTRALRKPREIWERGWLLGIVLWSLVWEMKWSVGPPALGMNKGYSKAGPNDIERLHCTKNMGFLCTDFSSWELVWGHLGLTLDLPWNQQRSVNRKLWLSSWKLVFQGRWSGDGSTTA